MSAHLMASATGSSEYQRRRDDPTLPHNQL